MLCLPCLWGRVDSRALQEIHSLGSPKLLYCACFACRAAWAGGNSLLSKGAATAYKDIKVWQGAELCLSQSLHRRCWGGCIAFHPAVNDAFLHASSFVRQTPLSCNSYADDAQVNS